MSPTDDPPAARGDGTPTVLPECIGRYRILAQLGAGGMGTVYKAHDPQLNRVVALKVPHFAGTPEQQVLRAQRFQREARAAAQVWHPHVCPIFDVGVAGPPHDGRPFVVMAYVEGTTLQERLRAGGRFEHVPEAISLVRQILEALSAVHARGIVHRDLKPANILLDPAGRAVVTDFGLARPEDESEALTSDGVVMGTPAYMAPEQAAGRREDLGPWTDLYSLGVVLYEMLTGRLPFPGTGPAVLVSILHDEVPPPRQFRPELDPGLETVILRALGKAPAERFPDATTFSAALSGFAEQRGLQPSPPAEPLTTSTPGAERGTPMTVPVAPPSRPARAGMVGRLLGNLQSAAGLPQLRGRSPGWVVGWLLGGLLIAAGMGVVAWVPLLMTAHGFVTGTVIGGCFVAFMAIAIPVLLGLGCWEIAEQLYTPTGLWRAARAGRAGRVQRILAAGVPPDLPDEMGETALLLAAAGGHSEVVKVLLLQGADSQAHNPFGQTALDVARGKGHGDIADLLTKRPPPARPRPGPARQPQALDARRCLLLAAAVGALLAFGLYKILAPWPRVITYQEMLWLAETGQVLRLRVYQADNERRWIEGEVQDRDAAFGRGYRFMTTEVPKADVLHSDLRSRSPTLKVESAIFIGGYWTRNPAAWILVPMLAVPIAVAYLLGLSLGQEHWFPALRPGRQSPPPR